MKLFIKLYPKQQKYFIYENTIKRSDYSYSGNYEYSPEMLSIIIKNHGYKGRIENCDIYEHCFNQQITYIVEVE